jgi:hypothetical protein
MMICRLCGLTIDKIPDDAIQAGKLYRFSTGEYHYLRKKPEPRIGARPRKANLCSESLPLESTTPSTPVMGTKARDIPEHVEPIPPAVEVDETLVGETVLGRAFRLLAKVNT